MTAFIATGMLANAQAPAPFTLGTFELARRTFVGIVPREALIIDFAGAHAAVQTAASAMVPPSDLVR